MGPRSTVGMIYKEDHCTLLTQNMKALALVVSEKKFFHCKSMGAICCHGNQSSYPT